MKFSMEIPKGFLGRIAGRSGLALKYGKTAHVGTIDADYRGVVEVILFNLTDNLYVVRAGDRFAQLMIEKCYKVKFIEIDDHLPETERGNAGFGSSLGF